PPLPRCASPCRRPCDWYPARSTARCCPYCSPPPRDRPSFPTRRSSDLLKQVPKPVPSGKQLLIKVMATTVNRTDCGFRSAAYFIDRKSTRLNSSHVKSSYAVFCLKKKKAMTQPR